MTQPAVAAALHMAAANGHAEVAACLLTAGAVSKQLQ